MKELLASAALRLGTGSSRAGTQARTSLLLVRLPREVNL